MRATIIINNFNYGRYIVEAVESALSQTHPDTEVIVVDDESTDNSLEILESYRSRIKLIAKKNGGQASCYAAGFAQCSGNVVLFLDADDYLDKHCIERVLRNWTEEVSKAHFYLAVVNGEGEPLGAAVPSGRLADREALEMMHLFGSYCSSPGSGNVFAAKFLKNILPLKNESELVHDADAVPIFAAPFYGRVLAVNETLGFYRRHAKASSSVLARFDRDSALKSLLKEHQSDLHRDHSWRLACEYFDAVPFHLLEPSRAKRRLCYLRLSGGQALVAGDTRMSLVFRSIAAIARWSGYTFIQKILACVWFMLVGFLPMSLCESSIKVALGLAERKSWHKRLLGRSRTAAAAS